MKTSPEGVVVILNDAGRPVGIVRKDLSSTEKPNMIYMLEPASEEEISNMIEGRMGDEPIRSLGQE